MVTYWVTKIIPTCSPVIGQFFDTMIVVSILIKSGCNDTSKSTSWNVLETVWSHLNRRRESSNFKTPFILLKTSYFFM